MVALISVVSLSAATGSASAKTGFGTNLNRPASVTWGCEAVAAVDNNLYPTGQRSCTLFSNENPPNPFAPKETHVVPRSGVITQVRLRTGSRVGPMRFTILRQIRAPQSTQAACCFEVAHSDTFNPAPNRLNRVSVRLPVRVGPDVNGILEQDVLSLSLRNLNSSLPAFNTGNHSADGDGFAGLNRWFMSGYYPEMLTGDERPPPGTQGGLIVLMDAAVEPTLRLPASASVAKDIVRLRAQCLQSALCRATLLLQSGRVFTAGDEEGNERTARAAAVKTYGKQKFKIKGGKRKTVRIKLNRRGRKAVRGKRTTRVWATTVLKHRGGTLDGFSERVKLKR